MEGFSINKGRFKCIVIHSLTANIIVLTLEFTIDFPFYTFPCIAIVQELTVSEQSAFDPMRAHFAEVSMP